MSTMQRRQMLRAWMALAPASLWFAGSQTFAAAAPRLRAKQVAKNTWFVEGEAALGSRANRNFVSNAAFIVTGAGVVVIDALGSPTLARELLSAIAGVTPQRVTHVIVTHYHADHIYGLQVFKAAGAKILAHPASREYLHSDAAQLRLQASREELAPWVDEKTRLVAADEWVVANETTLKLGRHVLRLAHVGPAHTPEDLVVFDASTGVLFAGDIVYRGRLPFVGQADSAQWIASLNRLMRFEPKVIVPGHGPVSTSPRKDLAMTHDYLVYLRTAMGDAAKNLEPFEEAYAKTDWSAYQNMPLFKAANRINAYNTYLLMEQQGLARPK